jgi:hypothetical protein
LYSMLKAVFSMISPIPLELRVRKDPLPKNGACPAALGGPGNAVPARPAN